MVRTFDSLTSLETIFPGKPPISSYTQTFMVWEGSRTRWELCFQLRHCSPAWSLICLWSVYISIHLPSLRNRGYVTDSRLCTCLTCTLLKTFSLLSDLLSECCIQMSICSVVKEEATALEPLPTFSFSKSFSMRKLVRWHLWFLMSFTVLSIQSQHFIHAYWIF